MKYDTQAAQISPLLQVSQNIAVILPADLSVDKAASGLALYLSLKQSGRNVTIATSSALTVGFSHLFGVGEIKNSLSDNQGGNYTITLGGVVAPDGKVPTLQNLDWAPTGATKSDLKLTFHNMPGTKFEPTFVTPAYEGTSFDLIITIGAQNLDSLGQTFSNVKIINIDNQPTNTNFGTVNLVDNTASSLSEIIGSIIPSLGLSLQGDIASNIIAGIYSATADLLQGTSADTFEVLASVLRVGGQKPSALPNTAPIIPISEPAQNIPVQNTPPAWAQPAESVPQTQGFDVSPFLNPQNFSVTTAPQEESQPQAPSQSAEEVPVGEAVRTESPEADWLTPKIFKGKVS